jgi:hypothetical protein
LQSNPDQETLKLLQDLVVENPDLERLEDLLSEFNIFEALGAVQVELRHSAFLAFLLNPNQNHGLGDAFVRRLLQRVLVNANVATLPLSPIEIDLLDLDDLLVLREWQNIDLLLVDDRSRLVVYIENKIGSGEHSDQLQRYRAIVEQQYKGWHTLGIYLTPDGDEPSDDSYIPVSYQTVHDVIEHLLEARGSQLSNDVKTLLTNYTQMLRRYILSETEIAELCRRIYRKHQRALDLIFEFRTDIQAEIQDILLDLIENQADLSKDHSGKSIIRFAPRAWDTPRLTQCQGWTESCRTLLFEFWNRANRLSLKLVLGPGPEEARKALFELAVNNPPLLRPAYKALNYKYNTIYQKTFLTEKFYTEEGSEEREAEIRKKWAQFWEHDLPGIDAILRQQPWIWENEGVKGP